MRLRVPAWASGLEGLAVDGEPALGEAVPGAIVIEREWQPGARITFRVPLTLRAERLPDDSAWQAFLAGPIVLAARGDSDGLVGLRGDDARWGHVAGGPLRPLADVPIVADAGAGDLLTETAPLRYRLRTADPDGGRRARAVRGHPRRPVHGVLAALPRRRPRFAGRSSRHATSTPSRRQNPPRTPIDRPHRHRAAGEDTMITIADTPSHTIDRRVYGQFAEHLGRCIYEGVWVGADSGIPNTNGIRNDVVDGAPRRSRCRSCAGRAAASPTSTTG